MFACASASRGSREAVNRTPLTDTPNGNGKQDPTSRSPRAIERRPHGGRRGDREIARATHAGPGRLCPPSDSSGTAKAISVEASPVRGAEFTQLPHPPQPPAATSPVADRALSTRTRAARRASVHPAQPTHNVTIGHCHHMSPHLRRVLRSAHPRKPILGQRGSRTGLRRSMPRVSACVARSTTRPSAGNTSVPRPSTSTR